MVRRSILITTLAVVGLLAGAGPSAADPGNGNGQSTYPMVCDGELSTLTVGGGPWSAADLGESGGTFVPESTHFTIHDGDGELLYEEHDAKNRGAKGTSSCVDEAEIDGLYYRFVVEGKITGQGASH